MRGKMSPAISVLMSVYNGEKFLREAVDSILAQTFNDFEFVIVNDGSKDSSGDILSSYDDPRLKFLAIENRGLAAALNYGLEHCQADLVVRMDADDVAYPDRIEASLADWKNANRPDVFGSGADYINENGEHLWSIQMHLDDTTIKTALRAPDGRLSMLHPTVLFRKAAVLSCGGYDPYFKNCQDSDLWLRMTDRYTFGNSPRRLLKYRFQTQSTTATSIRAGTGELNFGSWMKLVSHQKKRLIDAGQEELWNSCRDGIIAELKNRVDIPTLRAEASVTRHMTDAKILLYSGKRVEGISVLGRLFLRHPKIFLNRIVGGPKTKISEYLIDATELKNLPDPC